MGLNWARKDKLYPAHLIRQEMMKPSAFLDLLPKQDSWCGGHISVIKFLGDEDETK